MASGRTHAAISVAASPVAFFTALNYSGSVELASFAAVGCGIVGIVLTPDLDQQTKSWIENKMLRNQNIIVALVGILHYWFWLPYAKAFPHRAFATHFPIISTAIRLAYIAVGLLAVYWLATNILGMTFVLPDIDKILPYAVATIYGLTISDTLHWLTDVVSSGYKKYFKRNKRRMPRQKTTTRKRGNTWRS